MSETLRDSLQAARRAVLELLRTRGSLAPRLIAEWLNLDRETTRRILVSLQAAGKVDASDRTNTRWYFLKDAGPLAGRRRRPRGDP